MHQARQLALTIASLAALLASAAPAAAAELFSRVASNAPRVGVLAARPGTMLLA
ncbi:MAG: hypothetical protein ABIU54_11705 [Candidatus Eisenbacteria bacterium]